ncbi:unnamed protein product, partial [Dibothriocephalus latus]
MGIKAAGVGTYENLALVTPSTKLVKALTFFEGERVSALPVVDSVSTRRLLDIFAKFDVITLILAGMYKKMDMTVQDVLDICKYHRLIIVDNHQDCRVEGVVSISDLLSYMVLGQSHSQTASLTLSTEAVKAILPDWQFLSEDTEPVGEVKKRPLLPFEEHEEVSADAESDTNRQSPLLPK